VQRHSSQSTSIEAIRKQFIHFAKDDEANFSQFVAISRLGARMRRAPPCLRKANECHTNMWHVCRALLCL